MDEATREAAEQVVASIADLLEPELYAAHQMLIRTVVQEVVRQGWTPSSTSARLLGPADEPQHSGAVVAVHYGDYRLQEVWVSSGANVGNWYPLGGEFWVTWDRQRMPAGVTQQHPHWEDVLARGPVTLLVSADVEAYRQGWRAGRRDLWQAMEEAVEAEPGESR